MEKLASNSVIVKAGFHLVLILLVAYTGYSIFSATQRMYWDFPNYYVSARLVAEGESVSQFYDNAWFENEARQMGIAKGARFNPFPPLTAWVLLPLSGLEPMAAKQVWTLFNAVVLLVTIALWRKVFRMEWTSSAFVILLPGIALATNFKLGQIYLIALCLLLLTYHYYQKKRYSLAATALSLVSMLKYFPVVFIAGFTDRKFLIRFLLGCSVLAIIQLVIFGPGVFQTYIQVLLNHLNGNIDGQGQHLVQFQSFDSLLSFLFVENPESSMSPLVNFPAGKTIGKLAVLLVTGASLVFAFKKLKYLDNETRADYQLALTGMAAFVVLPATASYHLVLILFPLGVMIKQQLKAAQPFHVMILLGLYAIACNSGVLGLSTSPFEGIKILLNYPRLWALVALYGYAFWLVISHAYQPTKESVTNQALHRLW